MRPPLDLRLALAPIDTYRQLITEPVRGTWLRALERPALVALIIGITVTISSARRVSLGLVIMGVLLWSFVPIIQWLVGTFVIGRVRGRPMSMPRCLELLFIGHLPWSLWALTMAGLETFTVLPVGRAVEVLSLSVPAVWTAMIVFAFCRTVLDCTPARARLLTVAHQAITGAIFFTYVVLFSGFWARFLALIGA